ncbi:MAG: TIGR00282 family metallophosphoesterase [Patescibacteria group bacterium]|jgi:metallophosphoesterase (TIGR00282 family)|nr:TIGR00282 family metallophosphoesterase [Patescibacteria group bacterium]
MKILFIGDIIGKPGREIINKTLPSIIKEKKIDIVIANPENAAHGRGVTPEILEEIQKAGVDVFSGGDHSFDDKHTLEEVYNGKFPIVRPANYCQGVPGLGYIVFKKGKYKILHISLIGRVFMKMDYECPFRELDKILANFARQKFSAIIVDIHAEATSEKNAMFRYANSRVSAVLGTHTHVMTADEKVSKEGTAYITDVGMAGFDDGCIGIETEGVIETFLTQMRSTHGIPDTGKSVLNSVIIDIDPKTKKANKIKSFKKYLTLK